MHPLYQSRRLQIWLLGTCSLLGPQRHVQERPENFRFSGVTNMQVSMGWFIADCHQEISRTLIHLLVTHAYPVDKDIQTYAKHSSLFDLCLQNVSFHMPSSLPLQKSPHVAVLSSIVTGFRRAALYGQIWVGVYHRKSFQALHSNICWRVIWFRIDESECFPTDLLQQKSQCWSLNLAKKNNQKHLCFASGDGNKSAYQSKVVGLSSACSS
jgi:hypothetical protein